MAGRWFGAHMPTGGGLDKALRRGSEIGCTAVQVFTTSPRNWASKDPTEEAVAAFRAAVEETGIGSRIVSHDTYLVNLCATSPEIRSKSVDALTAELRRCSMLGIPLVVSHMGAHMGQGEQEGLKIVSEATVAILAGTPADVTLLMETTAGQGTCLNYDFEHLAMILELSGQPSRLAVCLDTCHVFAAGYDIRTEDGVSEMLDQFDRIVGLDRLMCVHVNDSKFPLGSRKDRHEHLGQGEIGEAGFRALLSDSRLFDVPFVVETPDAETQHAANVARLWEWSGERVPA
ncbi:MAG: deoxyribonuclease IV [Fimbriimonadaceae bacterium]|nr:deoxyribonuclease IV [Fimbriimonadaceae bacterium]